MSYRIFRIIALVTLPICFIVTTICQAQTEKNFFLSNSFEKGTEGWKPRDGIKISIVKVKGIDGKCLGVKGKQKNAWNFAGSAPFGLRPKHIYRITARLLVKKADPKMPPYFKVELAKAGRIKTTVYDLARGGWQELQGHFRCPEESNSAWVGLEKGGKIPVEIEAYIADVKVVEIKYFKDPDFATFRSIKAKHPRLFFTDSEFFCDNLAQSYHHKNCTTIRHLETFLSHQISRVHHAR